MKIINLKQGSDEWLNHRLDNLNASEAPAMMGASPYMTRNQLLDLKKFKQVEEVSAYKQAIFDKGHAAEDAARELLEMEELTEYQPLVVMREIDGITLAASLDGIEADSGIPWEHKLYNNQLAENIRNNVIEAKYYWQLEQQMLVANVDSCLFMCSDGTAVQRESMVYESKPERRTELIDGWKQFLIDLETHKLKPKAEIILANEIAIIPVIHAKVIGADITTNIRDALDQIKALTQSELSKHLESDQDFADKEKLNKEVKAARSALKATVSDIESQFKTFSDFAVIAKELDSVFQKLQSAGEKQVKTEKLRKKQALVKEANDALIVHVDECHIKTTPFRPIKLSGDFAPDWETATKNKRTLSSLQNAIDSHLAELKIRINSAVGVVASNIKELKDIGGLDLISLFPDIDALLIRDSAAFNALIQSRINEHNRQIQKQAEAEAARKIEAERLKIQAEERKKIQDKERELHAERLKIQAEAARMAEPEKMQQQKNTQAAAKNITEVKNLIDKKIEEDSLSEALGKWKSRHNIGMVPYQNLLVILRAKKAI